MGARRTARRVGATGVACMVLLGNVACSSNHGPSADPKPTRGPTQLVGVGHVAVEVPASWSRNHFTCGTPQSDTVIVSMDARTDCRVLWKRGIDAIDFGPRGPITGPGSEAIDIDGASARRSAVECGDVRFGERVEVCRIALHVTQDDVWLMLESSTSRAEVEEMVGWVQVRKDLIAVPPTPGGYHLPFRPMARETKAYLEQLEQLEQIGLHVELRHVPTPRFQHAGTVAGVEPGVGSMLKPGSVVRVDVNAGPPAR